jgi:DNA-binding CsgD family transcriptional regulator
MIGKSRNEKQYRSAHDRFLKPAIINFLVHELRYLGPVTAANVSDELIGIFEENVPQKDRLKHGQMLWNTLDKNTRGDSKNRKYKSVVLSVVTDEDVTLFEQGKSIREIRKQVIARIMKEAYRQGGILSTRDVALILATNDSSISKARIDYETEHQTVLPHPGVLHDMGSTLTHKQMIVHKYVVEKKETNIIALETNHSQRAVDHYIRDYNRVKILLDDHKNLEFIHLATKIAKPVIAQYQAIFNQYVKER